MRDRLPPMPSPMLAWVTAALTFVLILVTGFYAWANYRVMRIMQADVRARTEPIPKLGVDFRAPGIMKVQVRTEHVPMRLIELSFHFVSSRGRIKHLECVVGDPRTISPETPGEFAVRHKLVGVPDEWVALIRYADLGEAFEYRMKLNSKGYSLVQANPPPGPMRQWVKRVIETANEKIDEMDG